MSNGELLCSPGSYNDFTEKLIETAGYDPGEGILVKEYTTALAGLNKRIAETQSITALQVHNPEFEPLRSGVNAILGSVAA